MKKILSNPKFWNAVQALVIAVFASTWVPGVGLEQSGRPIVKKVVHETEYVTIETAEGHKLQWPADGDFSFEGDFGDLFGDRDVILLEEAYGSGVGMTAMNNEAEFDMDSVAPAVSAGSASARGGSSGFGLTTKITQNKGATWMIMGGLFIAAGMVYLIWLRAVGIGLSCIGTGIVLGAAAFYPWLLLVAVGCIAVAGVFMFLDYRDKRAQEKSLRAVVSAGGAMSEKSQKEFKALVAESAGDNLKVIKKKINRIKEKI